MKRGISVVLCLLLLWAAVMLFASCGAEQTVGEKTGEQGSQTAPEESDGEIKYEEDEYIPEYEVKDFEVEEGAFEVEGKVSVYTYGEVPGAEKVIDIINDCYGADLKLDEDTHYENGYGNWFWDDGHEVNPVSASVSMSSKTGKFSLFYMPDLDTVTNASKIEKADEKELEKAAADFTKKFGSITGRMKLSSAAEYNDNYFTFYDKSAKEYGDLQANGMRFLFVSDDFSRQTVSAQPGLDCYVECAGSDISVRDTQFFVVTMLNDGTIISADNCITSAPIEDAGYRDMIDESDMDKLISFFTSTAENDTLIIKRLYIDSYSNYFGYPEIYPIIKVEYCFGSDPGDVQTTEISIEGFDS